MLAAWLSERYFRTFRIAPDTADTGGFDALLLQRERRIGVTTAVLWDGDAPQAGVLEDLLARDVEPADSGYALWVPAGAAVPAAEPDLSAFRVQLARWLRHLQPAERREMRIPITLYLAQIDANGAYISVTGGLASHWAALSEGVQGAYHLDARQLYRLPEQEAEQEIVLTHVRDRCALLEPGERTELGEHDYWTVSRVPGDQPPGLTVVAAPPTFDAGDGATLRRLLRQAITRATTQRAEHACDFTALAVVAPLAHMADEHVTAALRGMNPAAYSSIDLIVLVADGQVRQVLQPRAVPWESGSRA